MAPPIHGGMQSAEQKVTERPGGAKVPSIPERILRYGGNRMSHRYFKLVSTYEDRDNWVKKEFLEGRARFGWSPPGADLTGLGNNPRGADLWPEDVRWAWWYSNFLVRRLRVGDRVVVQTKRPIREFLVGEIIEPGYSYDGGEPDFNHVLKVQPLTTDPVSVNSKLVPEFLKHDLSKRGRYYEIYPKRSIFALDELVEEVRKQGPQVARVERPERDSFDRAREAAKAELIRIISDTWRRTGFEKFVADLLGRLPYVEVKELSDTRKGWDMLIQLTNPISGEVLFDQVPVQCKNYEHRVDDGRPIDDLVRCVKNCESSLALLVIMGDLTDEFRARVSRAAADSAKEHGREIVFEIIDQDRIAELYASTMVLDDMVLSAPKG